MCIRDRPRPAHLRGHQLVHPAVALLPDDRAGRGDPVDRVHRRAVVDLARAGVLPGGLRNRRHAGHGGRPVSYTHLTLPTSDLV